MDNKHASRANCHVDLETAEVAIVSETASVEEETFNLKRTILERSVSKNQIKGFLYIEKAR